jgi:PKD repeat protein
MSVKISYDDAKSAMDAAGFPTSDGNNWEGQDAGSYQIYAASVCYGKEPYDSVAANYGFAYPVTPDAIAEAVVEGSYSATVAGNPSSGNAPLSVTFTVTETGGNGTSFEWDFGDGSATQTTSTPTTTHNYTTAGSFTATVTPTVDGLQVDPVSAAPITVIEYSATMNGAPASGLTPLQVNFTMTETGGSGSSFEWDFGDGSQHQTTQVNNTSHTYTTAGSYTPTVTPTVEGIVQSPVTGNTITPSTYSATLAGVPASGTTPLAVDFTLTESGGTGTSYAWDFGDGNTDTTNTPTTSHTYTTAGTFNPTCTPTVDGTPQTPVDGNAITTTDYSLTLVASPDSGTTPLMVTLTGTESGGTGTSFAWDFGDSNTDTTNTPVTQHTYASAGTYTPKVTPTVGGTARPQVSGNEVTVS